MALDVALEAAPAPGVAEDVAPDTGRRTYVDSVEPRRLPDWPLPSAQPPSRTRLTQEWRRTRVPPPAPAPGRCRTPCAQTAGYRPSSSTQLGAMRGPVCGPRDTRHSSSQPGSTVPLTLGCAYLTSTTGVGRETCGTGSKTRGGWTGSQCSFFVVVWDTPLGLRVSVRWQSA